MTLVTVIIAARNEEALLGEALDSLVAQSHPDWEAVVVDDGSEDATAEVAARYAPRVRVLRNPRSLGLAGARNVGLRAARGELVALLDADDWWEPAYLTRQVARYEEARASGVEVGLLACNARVFDGRRFLPGTYGDTLRRPLDATLEHLLMRNVIFVGATAPRALLLELGGFAEELRRSEDYDLWLRIAETGQPILVTPEPLVVYRRRAGSLSRDIAAMAAANRAVLRRALARGRLTPEQRRVAVRSLRVNRAIEEIAEAWQAPDGERLAARLRLARRLPWVVGVLATHLDVVSEWAGVVRRQS